MLMDTQYIYVFIKVLLNDRSSKEIKWPVLNPYICKKKQSLGIPWQSKQPRCPSTDEWIKRLWYIYTMEYYSLIKRNGFESVLVRWMNLEPVIQSETGSESAEPVAWVRSLVRKLRSHKPHVMAKKKKEKKSL